MKKFLIIVNIIVLSSLIFAGTGPNFNDFFINKTMRIDFYQTGTKTQTIISLDEVIEEPIWAGSLTNLIDTLNLGHHILKIFDEKSGQLIFSRDFCTIFGEWHTTDEAAKEIFRTFSASVLIPFPKNLIRLTLSSRNRQNEFVEEFSTVIDPNSRFVNRDKPRGKYKAKTLIKNGSPNRKVDILVLPEGYTKRELKKFKKELKHLVDVFFSNTPFKENKDKFNVWYLEVPSEESGIDDPRKGKFVKSAFSLSFNTLDIDRYVQGPDNKTMRDIAANAPYDQIYFIFNSSKYGGGGIFNFCSCCYSHTDKKEQSWWPDYVFVHEFGHAFAGLADEYYSSSVTYNEFYPLGVEPWESNITALLNPENLKWKKLVEPDTPIPTPWNKEKYDKIPRSQSKDKEVLLHKQEYWGKVGAFKGGGYASEGLYRPYLDCRMFSKSLTGFCPVCSDAIVKIIRFYSE